jgi:hypothetical protein
MNNDGLSNIDPQSFAVIQNDGINGRRAEDFDSSIAGTPGSQNGSSLMPRLVMKLR